MPAPVEARIILPNDSGNAGPKVRTRSQSIGGHTVHQHMFTPVSRENILGMHFFSATAVASVQASAQNGTSTAHFWMLNPTGGTVALRLRRFKMYYDWGSVPAADVTTLPRTVLQRFTFTGTASGAQITACQRDSNDAAAVGTIRTASTGMTVSLVANAIAFASTAPLIDFATAVGINVHPREVHDWIPENEDEYIVLRPGHGLVFYQPDAGTASDLRRIFYRGLWDEIDIS